MHYSSVYCVQFMKLISSCLLISFVNSSVIIVISFIVADICDIKTMYIQSRSVGRWVHGGYECHASIYHLQTWYTYIASSFQCCAKFITIIILYVQILWAIRIVANLTRVFLHHVSIANYFP